MPLRILIVYNARSGHRRLNFNRYLAALAEKGAQVEMRLVPRNFKLDGLLADAKSFDRVVVAGGDGTVSTVAGHLQGTGIPIVAYPGGTANLLARNLRMPSTAEALAETTLNGTPVRTDLGLLEYVRYTRRELLKRRFLHRSPPGTPVKIHFSIMAGCGFAAKLMSQAQPLKPVWGEAAYWFSIFWNFFPHRAHFLLKMDGKEIAAEGIGILIVNFEKIQLDLKVVEGSKAQDGLFEVVVVKARSLFGLAPVLWGALCERLGFPRAKVPEVMETYFASQVEITSRPPLKLQFDGEVLKKAGSFKVSVCPGAALFVYGPGGA